jgi:hypothetical protein
MLLLRGLKKIAPIVKEATANWKLLLLSGGPIPYGITR